MSACRHLPYSLLALCLATANVAAQIPARAATAPAAPDGFSTETGEFLLSIPGVGHDFVLFADGQWQERADGSARLTAYVQRLSAVDRDFFVELTFTDRIDPGAIGHPPVGSPVTTLVPAAYAPIGPSDPSQWHYYTTVSGTMTGLRAFAGARVDCSNVGSAQVGVGANNKNTLVGLSVELDLTVVAPPSSASFVPTGAASLRCDLRDSMPMCATHVDGDVNVSGSAARAAFELPGVADDYLFLPAGPFVEHADGTATLTTHVRRQADHDDGWDVQLTFSDRVDPGDVSHPPAGAPTLALLPPIYAQNGGPIDPGMWRYYTTVTGTLNGTGDNVGGELQVSESGAVQVGLGADGGNIFFGLAGQLAIAVTTQPSGRTLNVTGDASLRANLAVECILPQPTVLTGDAQIVENVHQTLLVYTGDDLGFVEQAAIGPLILGPDDRNWFGGRFHIVDHETIELSIPQGLLADTYPVAFLNSTRVSNQVSLDVVEPTQPIIRTENDRLGGEPQHYVVHRGNLGPAISWILASLSETPSSAPGIVDLQIGAGFTDLFIVDIAIHDPLTGAGVLTLPYMAPTLAGLRIHYQAAMLTSTFSFPLTPTVDYWSTDYLP